jgi:hypothetical protein
MNLHCLACIEAHVTFLTEQENGKHPAEEEAPEIREAYTLAPSWQTHTMMGQMMMTCVALPSCYEHLVPQKKSPMERSALAGGVLIPGPGNGPRP